jgi:hypothetical protein
MKTIHPPFDFFRAIHQRHSAGTFIIGRPQAANVALPIRRRVLNSSNQPSQTRCGQKIASSRNNGISRARVLHKD